MLWAMSVTPRVVGDMLAIALSMVDTAPFQFLRHQNTVPKGTGSTAQVLPLAQRPPVDLLKH